MMTFNPCKSSQVFKELCHGGCIVKKKIGHNFFVNSSFVTCLTRNNPNHRCSILVYSYLLIYSYLSWVFFHQSELLFRGFNRVEGTYIPSVDEAD